MQFLSSGLSWIKRKISELGRRRAQLEGQGSPALPSSYSPHPEIHLEAMAEDHKGLDLGKVQSLIRLHEGTRHHVYKDSLGIATIGVGRNVESSSGPGLRHSEINFMLLNDVAEAYQNCSNVFPFFAALSDVRKAVMIDMCHNLGIDGLRTFKTTLKFIENGAYTAAAEQMLKSKWAGQVGVRAKRLSGMMHYNEWPKECG